MVRANRTLKDVNDLLLQQLYDGIDGTADSEELLNFTEAVAKLNSSFKNNDQVAEKEVSEAERIAQEEKEAFAVCAEGEIVDGNQ